jgi:hypothetical protein
LQGRRKITVAQEGRADRLEGDVHQRQQDDPDQQAAHRRSPAAMRAGTHPASMATPTGATSRAKDVQQADVALRDRCGGAGPQDIRTASHGETPCSTANAPKPIARVNDPATRPAPTDSPRRRLEHLMARPYMAYSYLDHVTRLSA